MATNDAWLDQVKEAALEPDLPRHLASLCRRALAVEPADRPASADEFVGAIRAWRSDAAREREVHVLLGQAATALEVESPSAQPDRRHIDGHVRSGSVAAGVR